MIGGVWFTAAMAALLFGGWVYNKFMRTTGGNVKNALTAAAFAGFLLFLFAGVLLTYLFNRFS